ncbi:MAG TPA: sensor histidine kinase [Solirubrobacteraceae bacterium]|nr:sensor histidine kinase [Solirubrobacteraceae bacterium]
MGLVPIRRPAQLSLLTRVFLANTLVLAILALLLLFTPIEISFPVTNSQAVIIVSGFVISVAVNLLLLRGLVAPLRRLTETMRSVEPLEPGRRLAVAHADAEVQALTTAFNDMLGRLERERRESGRRALAAQEHERQRVARELHDEVGQILTGVMLELEHAQLPAARDSVRQALEEVRRIARELRPEMLDDLGLQSALRALCASAAAQVRVERRLELDGVELTPEVELVVYRIAQESLTNVLRHSNAAQVLVALGTVDGGLRLVVRDDGRGLPADVRAGAGIAGMRERALHIGGRLSVTTLRDGGTEVRLDVPL